jgi:uncharacterized membrane protein (UPF0136 family)
MFEIAKAATISLGVLSIVGGIIGFKKAKSKPSLIAGTISGLALGICFVVSLTNPTSGLTSALVITGILDLVFLMRLMKTKKMMPAGIMLIACLSTGALLAKTLFF